MICNKKQTLSALGQTGVNLIVFNETNMSSNSQKVLIVLLHVSSIRPIKYESNKRMKNKQKAEGGLPAKVFISCQGGKNTRKAENGEDDKRALH